ncbi:MAG: outer membrane beta-barrel protein [Bacteroidales bacterium]
MKKITAFVLALGLLAPILAQDDTIPARNPEKHSEAYEAPGRPDMSFDTPDKTRVTVGKNEIFIIEANGDTTKLQLGSKGLSIVEGNDGYAINVIEMNGKQKENNAPAVKKEKMKKFKPHYGGFEIGLNNFLDPDHSLHTGDFMDLNTAKSWNYNLNFLEYGIGLGTSYAGLVTGMGFEWSNYIFDGNNSIEKEINGNIISRPEPYNGITKSKLSMTYLNVPLLLEFQIPAGNKRIHVSGGITGGVKLASKTKIKYQDGGRQKEVRKDDFSLSPFRYGATVRVGYRAINLFANYYFSPLFGETAEPELYPFSVGLNLISF